MITVWTRSIYEEGTLVSQFIQFSQNQWTGLSPFLQQYCESIPHFDQYRSSITSNFIIFKRFTTICERSISTVRIFNPANIVCHSMQPRQNMVRNVFWQTKYGSLFSFKIPLIRTQVAICVHTCSFIWLEILVKHFPVSIVSYL